MTRNQLEYWKNQETERHNLAMEQQGLLVLQETQRANRANESINQSSVNEAIRSNKARELENYRANLANEYQNLLRYNETVRSNQANEAIGRANVAVGWGNVAVGNRNAAVNEQNAVTNRLNTWDTNTNNARRNEIQANQNLYTSMATSGNLLTNLKSIATNIGYNVVTGYNNLVSSLNKVPQTVKSTVSNAINTPRITTPVSSYLGGSVKPVNYGATKATYNYKAAPKIGTRKSR